MKKLDVLKLLDLLLQMFPGMMMMVHMCPDIMTWHWTEH